MSPVESMPESLAWSQVVTWLFCIGWSFIAVYVANSIKRLTESVSTLNTNIAVIIEKVNGHEKRIERLEEQD